MSKSEYNFSFTSVTALVRETVELAILYRDFENWDKVAKTVNEENIFQTRTMSTSGRITREIKARLTTLNSEELRLLIEGTQIERKQLIWLAICQKYQPIYDFSLEVLVENHEKPKKQVLLSDYDHFFLRKSDWHPKLDSLADNTKRKAKNNLFKMMKQCGLLSLDDENMIITQDLSLPILEAINYQNNKVAIFPRTKM